VGIDQGHQEQRQIGNGQRAANAGYARHVLRSAFDVNDLGAHYGAALAPVAGDMHTGIERRNRSLGRSLHQENPAGHALCEFEQGILPAFKRVGFDRDDEVYRAGADFILLFFFSGSS